MFKHTRIIFTLCTLTADVAEIVAQITSEIADTAATAPTVAMQPTGRATPNTKKFSIQQKPPLNEEQQYRFDTLNQHLLQKYGLQIRDDSALAYMWATCQVCPDADGICWTFETVVNEIVVMQWLHKATPYGEMCQTGMRVVAHDIRTVYGLNHHTSWKITRKYAVPAFKCAAMRMDKHTPADDEWQVTGGIDCHGPAGSSSETHVR